MSREQLDAEEEEAIRAALLPATDRKALTQGRRGQGRFRSEVRKLEAHCRGTKVDERRLLVAGRIWPWRYATNDERLGPY